MCEMILTLKEYTTMIIALDSPGRTARGIVEVTVVVSDGGVSAAKRQETREIGVSHGFMSRLSVLCVCMCNLPRSHVPRKNERGRRIMWAEL